MFRKILSAMAILFATNVLLSVFVSCGCEDKTYYCVHLSGAKLKAIDNSAQHPTDVQNGQVIAKALILEMTLSSDLEICYKPKASVGFASAYAFTREPCEFYTQKDSIVAYDLYSDKDFDAQHPAGSNLLDLFNSDGADVLNRYTGTDVIVTFYSKAAVGDTGTHILTFRIVDHEGDTILASTPPIKLLK